MEVERIFSEIGWFYVALAAFIWVNVIVAIQIYGLWNQGKIHPLHEKGPYERKRRQFFFNRRTTVLKKALVPLLFALIINMVMIGIVLLLQLRVPVTPPEATIIYELKSADTQVLEQVLNEKLPDPSVLDTRHQELLDSISQIIEKEFQTPPPPAPSNQDLNLQILEEIHALKVARASSGTMDQDINISKVAIILFSLLFVFALSLIAFLWLKRSRENEKNRQNSRWSIKLSGAASVLSASTIGITLLSIAFEFDLDGTFDIDGQIQFTNTVNNYQAETESDIAKTEPEKIKTEYIQPTIYLASTSRNLPLDCGKNNEHKIWPFPYKPSAPGRKFEIANTDVEIRTEKVLNALSQKKYTNFVLIGSADKRPLNESAEKLYQSNFGLAQARARWVKTKIDEYVKTQNTLGDAYALPVMTFIAEPSDVAHVSTRTNDAQDRSVIICAY